MSKNGSKQLNEFVKSYNNLFNYTQKLAEKYSNDSIMAAHLIQAALFGINNEDAYWKKVDTKTRADLRTITIINQFGLKMMPNISELFGATPLTFDTEQGFMSALGHLQHKKFYHSPNKIVKIIEELNNVVDEYLKASYKERTSMDCVLDFLKICTNFLIMLFTFGASQSFFNTSTSRLEKIKGHHEALKSIHGKLTSSEQDIQLLAGAKGLEVEAEPTQLAM